MTAIAATPTADHPITAHAAATHAWMARCGIAAVTVFAAVALAQAASRPGFDIMRHPVSLLSAGALGWIQQLNFAVSGALMLVCAVGARRALAGARGRTWVPILLGIQGIGFVAASMFSLDPSDGFPAGTPLGRPTAMSTHDMLHMAAASPAFVAMIAACFVLARRCSFDGLRRWAIAGHTSGAIFLAGLVWCNSGANGGPLGLFAGAIVAWAYLAATVNRYASHRIA
ncbi:DUF998 domain-containing protein [Nocardia sp. NPDC046763]|uniref:DUF998 domain-containing protein n=1 Tax=Nocardia sp. NPDC046763 TaxID=3155256 RepID=UPI0033C48D5E